MNAQSINQTLDLLHLVERDVTLQKTGNGWWAGACPRCGGTDRFVVKQTPQGWRWLCRKCGDGKYHSVIDYVIMRDNVSFKDALTSLGENTITLRPKQKTKPIQQEYITPDEAWQDEAHAAILKANNRLLGEPQGQPGREYLASRGITPGAWYYWLLGFEVIHDRPAVVIPHLAINQQVLAVKYRFIYAKDKRYEMRDKSKPVLYGLQHANGGETLFIVEGELNCISIWQCHLKGVNVISTGAESLSGHGKDMLPQLARRYKKCVVWMDEEGIARQVGSLVGTATLLKSPKRESIKYDANELLQRDLLPGFLEVLLK